MDKVHTTRWDAAEHIRDDDDVAAYVEAAFEDGDPRVIAAALGDIARAKGMTSVARDAGMGRESLYKSLSRDGNPEFATIMKVMRALGIQLRVTVASSGNYPDPSSSSAAMALADYGEDYG